MYPPLDCFFGEYDCDAYSVCELDDFDTIPWAPAWTPAWLESPTEGVSPPLSCKRARAGTTLAAAPLLFTWPTVHAPVAASSRDAPAADAPPAPLSDAPPAAARVTRAADTPPALELFSTWSRKSAAASTRAQLKQLELHTASAQPFAVDVGGCVLLFSSAQAAVCAQQMLHLHGGPRLDLVWQFAADRMPPVQAALDRAMRLLPVSIDAAAWRVAEYNAARKALHARARVDDRFAATCAGLVRAKAIPKSMKFAGIYRNIGRSRRAMCL
jgi:hypothetical protein